MNEIQKTNTSVQVFNNSIFGELRTSGTWDNPLFCLADVCRSLDLANPTMVKSRLRQDGLNSIEVIDSMGRTQIAIFINEPNLYRCVFQSRKENAIIFQDWIFDEVLPEIRKTGGYGKRMSKTEMRLQVFMDMQSEINRQSNVIKKQTKRITALVSQLESEKEARRERLALASETRNEDVARWLSESGINGVVSLSALLDAYSSYCENNGISCNGRKKLSSSLRDLGFVDVRKAKGMFFQIEIPCQEN